MHIWPRRGIAGRGVLASLIVLLLSVSICWSQVPGIPLVRTDDPGETVASFLEHRDALESAVAAYVAAPSRAGVAQVNLLLASLRSLIDLDGVPTAARQRVGNATVLALLDVFGRVGAPDPGTLPPAASFDGEDVARIRLPGTPLRIGHDEDGARAGEWLFDPGTVSAAPRFLAGIASAPLHSTLGWESWTTTLPQLTGPAVPTRVAAAVPESWRTLWRGLPVWKWVSMAVGAGLVWGLLARIHRLTKRAKGPRAAQLHAVTPLLTLLAVQVVLPQVAAQLMPFSQMPEIVANAVTLLTFAALAWLFWAAVQTVVALRSAPGPDAPAGHERDLVRVLGAGIGGLGVLIILTTGAQRLGIPVLSLAAGLGIGGLAVALAVRPTLENLVGGLLLYLDRPVRIGDFCTFGAHSGAVERIGVRAVGVRALDRTLISIPNARFADMELINWAACDTMLIHRTMRLRLETSTDQLRYVLAEIRKMLHAHPRIDDATIRIRYLGPGDAGRELDLRYYVKTREWNEFFAIREDTLLRIDDIVEGAGAKYAVPARVLHVARDGGGVDPDLQAASEATVAAWRAEGTLPFPKFSPDALKGLDDTLDYPPLGSPDAGTAEHYRAATPETLSRGSEADQPPATRQGGAPRRARRD